MVLNADCAIHQSHFLLSHLGQTVMPERGHVATPHGAEREEPNEQNSYP